MTVYEQTFGKDQGVKKFFTIVDNKILFNFQNNILQITVLSIFEKIQYLIDHNQYD